MEERFGVSPTLFEPFLLFKRRKSWSLLQRDPFLQKAVHLKVNRVGLKAFRKVGDYIKPTTRMIQIFGRGATRGRVELDPSALIRLLEGEEIPLDLPMEPGYVILGWMGKGILGMGLYLQGALRSQIPVQELRRIHVP